MGNHSLSVSRCGIYIGLFGIIEMNIQTVAENLKNTIAGKEIQLAQWEAARSWKNADQQFVNETVQYLKINIDELKRILQDVEQCIKEEV
jgi:hypothetical protein